MTQGYTYHNHHKRDSTIMLELTRAQSELLLNAITRIIKDGKKVVVNLMTHERIQQAEQRIAEFEVIASQLHLHITELKELEILDNM